MPKQRGRETTGWSRYRHIVVVIIAICFVPPILWPWRAGETTGRTVESLMSSANQAERSSGPMSAATILHRGLYQPEKGRGIEGIERVVALDRLGDLMGRLKRPKDAAEVLQEALHLRSQAGLSLRESVGTMGSLAEVLRSLGRYEEGLALLERAQKVKGLPATAKKVLHAMSSQMHDCFGSPALALHEFEKSLRYTQKRSVSKNSGNKSSSSSDRTTLHHIALLRKARTTPGIPSNVAQAMTAAEMKHLTTLLKKGPWERKEQLPQRYIRGLTSRPWHNPRLQISRVSDHFDRKGHCCAPGGIQRAAPNRTSSRERRMHHSEHSE